MMKMRRLGWLLAGLSLSGIGVAAGQWLATPGEELSGGETTVHEVGQNAFSLPFANLRGERRTDFAVGNSFFKKNWVQAPASTTARDGLGPHFIARSCSACHALDGRGAPPVDLGEQPMALLIRLSIPGTPSKHAGVVPEPTYGDQFNNDAVDGVKPEGKVAIHYQEISGQFADGERYSLRKPTYQLTELGYGSLHPDTMLSPRIAPQVIGLGLLEAIAEKDILKKADPDDRDSDGISGRPNWVWDAPSQKTVLGRFGWKANTGSVAHQTAGAFLGDIGITNKWNPQEACTAKQDDCVAAPSGGKPEISDDLLRKVVFYSQTLAPPARRDVTSPQVLRGKQLFNEMKCATCHTPSYRTGALKGLPEAAFQTIHPYTDLLLHDMGEGLADGRPDFQASGREWKTPPLWGIGLFSDVNGHTFYLHDGRARSLSEAILWHGGEAEAAKQRFVQAKKAERDALLAFLNSL
ncbi:di-heme oxidoreductase family protein [Aquaspirillum serpens]|uniref:di-heme oxidoreductase family protein n=1 Tax=Aquaspirillum serpens TaxID=190 RepID=UPI00058C422C|nr:di-heme oxidoredictase family protein [Aquaspirillum serpens]